MTAPAGAGGGPVLALAGVTAGYGAIPVLDGLDLAVRPGEIVAVLGPNGSGKSTALRTAMGLTRLFAGTVALAGVDVTREPAARRAARGLGYVPQVRNVFGDLSVLDNLRMGAYLRPGELAAGTARAFALFPRLAERRRVLARDLSGGERRMLAIALALLPGPRVLLLDEPSSDLAPALADAVFAAIARVHADLGVPVLLVEQNVARALDLAHRVCVLVQGRTALDVPAARLDPADLHRLFLEGDAR